MAKEVILMALVIISCNTALIQKSLRNVLSVMKISVMSVDCNSVLTDKMQTTVSGIGHSVVVKKSAYE